MTSNEQHRAAMAHLVRTAAEAMREVATYWSANDLPGDFSTPETGFPFESDLDEQVAKMYDWADALAVEEAVR